MSPFQSLLSRLWFCRHQESERHFESVVNLVAVQPKRKAGPHAGEYGRDAMAKRGHMNIKIADRIR